MAGVDKATAVTGRRTGRERERGRVRVGRGKERQGEWEGAKGEAERVGMGGKQG